jgi:hypothetical protein
MHDPVRAPINGAELDPAHSVAPAPRRRWSGSRQDADLSAGLDPDLPPVLDALPRLVPSAQPAVVLTSLAVACIAAAVDECAVSVVEEGARYEIRRPTIAESGQWPAEHPRQELTLPVRQERCGAEPAFSAMVTLRWIQRRAHPSDVMIAQLLVERATDILRSERLAVALAAATDRADHLELALKSNREIGQAIGILMATRKVTAEQAFDLLRRISQHTNRKLHELATEIRRTGTLDVPGAGPL